MADNFQFDPDKYAAFLKEEADSASSYTFDPQKYQQYLQAEQTPGLAQSFPGGVAMSQPPDPNPAPSIQDKLGAAPASEMGITPDFIQNNVTPVEQQQTAHTAAQNTQNDAVAQQTEQALGAKYKPDELGDIQRTRLGLAPNYYEMDKTFHQIFPEGKTQMVNGPDGTQYVKLQKDDKSEPFLLSPGSVKSWSEWYQASNNPNLSTADRGAAFANSIKSWVEDNPRTSAKVGVETLIALASGGVGLGALGTTGAMFTGDAAMNMGLNAPYSGAFSTQTLVDSVMDGTFILAGYGAGTVANAGVALARGKGIIGLSEEGRQMIKDADELKRLGRAQGMSEDQLAGLSPTPSQVTNQKLIKLQTNISSRLIGTISDYVEKQRVIASKIFRGQYDRGEVEGLMNQTDQGSDYGAFSTNRTGTLPEAVDTLKTSKAMPITAPSTTSSDAASAINSQFGTYADRSKAEVDKLYKTARDIEEPKFDPKPALDAAAEANKGVSTLTKDERTPVYGADKDAAGNPIQVSTDVNRESTPIKEPQAALKDIIDRINIWKTTPPMPIAKTLDNGKVVTDSVMDQINALREEAWKLSQPGPAGETRGDEALAKKVYGGLNQMLNDASGANPDFADAWKTASAAAKKRFDYLEDPIVKRGYKQDEGDILSPGSTSANTMGGQVENLRKLKQMAQDGVITPESYSSEIDSQKRRLFADPETLSNKLSRLDKEKPDLRDELFPDKAEYQLYKNLGDAYTALKRGGIEESMGKSSNAYSLVEKLFAGSTKDLTTDELNSLAKATPNSPLGKQLRAAALDYIWAGANTSERGVLKLGANNLGTQIKGAEAEGGYLTRLLTPEDKQALHVFLRYSQGVEEGKDSLGASFAAYSEMSKLRELEHEALLKMVESFGFGKLVTSKVGQRLLYGTSGYMSQPGTLLKALAAGGGQYISPSSTYDKNNGREQ